jgi:hypothetical protein
MVRRRPTEERVRRVPISITIDRELYEFIESMIDRKMFKDRSHLVNAALDYLKWTLEHRPMDFYGPRTVKQTPPTPQPPTKKDPRLPR